MVFKYSQILALTHGATFREQTLVCVPSSVRGLASVRWCIWRASNVVYLGGVFGSEGVRPSRGSEGARDPSEGARERGSEGARKARGKYHALEKRNVKYLATVARCIVTQLLSKT